MKIKISPNNPFIEEEDSKKKNLEIHGIEMEEKNINETWVPAKRELIGE